MTAHTKQTALYKTHVELGAKMTPFAGYEMPLRYTSDKEEHNNVRENVGMFDVSHMGEFFVEGTEAKQLIQYVTSNDVEKLTPGKAQYSCLPNAQGGIVDDLLVYCISPQEYMLVVNASNIEKDWNWIVKHNQFEANMTNRSDEIALLAVQGPKALTALQPLTSVKLEELAFYTFTKGTFAGVDDVIISATGYTGSGGVELYIPNEAAPAIWEAIMEAGKSYGILPTGLAARDTLRLEMGFCLYGNDIDDTTSPLEAKLGWITKLNTNFVGAEVLQQQKEAGVSRKLVGLEMLEKGIPRSGYEILSLEGKKIGSITSGTMSPTLGKGIGMGYVQTAFASTDTELLLQVRNKQLRAKVVSLPFIKK